ncbi:hypothetical protein [Janthinobacterium sp. PSPC2-1]|uniref:hypothetical protein n=1 Tax=unclassified Janthinobacterium TaxID=2610881 RepID=UPI003CF140FC
MKTNKRPNKAQGYTLIEILLVLAGVSAITVGAIRLGGVVSQRSNIATATATARSIITGMDARYSTTANYSGAGAEPPTFVDGVKIDGNAILTPWGLATLLAESDQRPGDRWSVTFDSIPRDACAAFVVQASPLFAFTGINMQGNTAKEGEAVAPDEAAHYCNQAVNSVQFLALSLTTRAASVNPLWANVVPSSLPPWIAPPPAITDGGGWTAGGDESTTLYPLPTPTPIPPAGVWQGHPTRPTEPEPTPAPTPTPTPTPTAPPKCDEQSQPGQDFGNNFCVDKPTPAPTPTPTPAPFCVAIKPMQTGTLYQCKDANGGTYYTEEPSIPEPVLLCPLVSGFDGTIGKSYSPCLVNNGSTGYPKGETYTCTATGWKHSFSNSNIMLLCE